MRRIAAMPGGPADRFRYLKSVNATGRGRRRPAFVPIARIRGLWDQIARQAPALLKKIPAGSSLLQRLRARTRRTDPRQDLLWASDYIATWARIRAIESKVLQRHARKARFGSSSPSST